MASPRNLLAVDLSYQTYRASAAHKQLTSGRTLTGGLYGFLVTLAKQIRETKATHVVVCRDLKPYRRSEVYPMYKQLRKKTADEELLLLYQESIPLVLEALDVIGIPTVGQPGFESDDCIGWFVERHRNRFDNIYAASNDSDLYQLLWVENFRVLRQGIEDVVDRERLAAGPLGMTPDEFMLASALQGTHNDIEGIPGVGQKTALKIVKDPGLLRQYRERWGEIIDRNLALIKLPHPEFPSTRLPSPAHSFELRELYKFCGRFEIEATKSMIDSFEQVCP